MGSRKARRGIWRWGGRWLQLYCQYECEGDDDLERTTPRDPRAPCANWVSLRIYNAFDADRNEKHNDGCQHIFWQLYLFYWRKEMYAQYWLHEHNLINNIFGGFRRRMEAPFIKAFHTFWELGMKVEDIYSSLSLSAVPIPPYLQILHAQGGFRRKPLPFVLDTSKQ